MPKDNKSKASKPEPKSKESAATIIVNKAAKALRGTRELLLENLVVLRKSEEAIEKLVRKEVDLPQDIQLSALCGISSGTVIKVDKANLDCVLLGQAKGQFIKRDGDVVLVIHKRTRSS